ncbi:MAG: NAD(P)-dependent oxidoreductase [Verrucomicrobia bacterium]|nr:NAD(P)-dependent oxidoreductase [Verrucomicrobiota bacterium]
MAGDREVILITGASGRIGFKSAEYFSNKFQIVGFDVFLAGKLPDVELVAVDMATDESVKEGLDHVRKNYSNRIASVIHLAAYYSFNAPWSSNYDKITVKGTERLLKGLQQFDVDQFIFSSTMLVHKPTAPGIKITEDSPLRPTWGYPLSKVQTEELIHKERGKISTVNLRIAGVYDDHCHSIPLSNQLQRVFENQLESHVFAGDVTHGASFVHMDDLIEALSLCVQKRKALPPELTLLIGEDVTFSYDQLQRMMQRLTHGNEWKTWSVPKPIAKIGAWAQEHLPFMKPSFIKPWMIDLADDHYELDITRARKVLGWQPKYRVDKVIPKWIEELKRDPVMWYDENKLRAPRGLAQMRIK